jgi:hypothetical protein
MKCHCFVDNKCKQENSKKERLMLYEVIVISRCTIAQMKCVVCTKVTSAFLLLSLVQYLCLKIIILREYHPHISQCLGACIIIRYNIYSFLKFTIPTLMSANNVRAEAYTIYWAGDTDMI